MKGYNLRSEPFFNRLERRPIIGEVFRSDKASCGDPLTPIFYANPGDPITMKLLIPADKPRATSFNIQEHMHLAHSEDNSTKRKI